MTTPSSPFVCAFTTMALKSPAQSIISVDLAGSFVHNFKLEGKSHAFGLTIENDIYTLLRMFILETADTRYGNFSSDMASIENVKRDEFLKLMGHHRMNCLAKLFQTRGAGVNLFNYATAYDVSMRTEPFTYAALVQWDVCRMIMRNVFRGNPKGFEKIEWKVRY